MAWIDDNIFRYKGNDLLVMLYLITHMNENGVCSVGVRTLAADCGITYQSAREALKRLSSNNSIKQYTTQQGTFVTILNNESYLPPKRVKQRTKKSAVLVDTKKSLGERKKDFGLSLAQFCDENGGEYSRKMLLDFYHYWSEENQAKTRMRWEMQETWNVAGRLRTWANNNKNFKKNNNYGRETITDKIRRTVDEATEFRNRLAAQREADLEAGYNQ